MSASAGDALGGSVVERTHLRPRLHGVVERRGLVRGRVDDPVWVRPALLGLLAGTALLYLVDLSASGFANGFYSAAVQAGTKSWKAFFFGSFDSSNFITVDKPPASLWPMELSARLFGVSSWSILVPQPLEGVATVALLYATVRRRFSPGAGLLAGAVLALTPVATLIFRFNNPDALLTLLLVGAAYGLTRALERARLGWLLLVATLLGFGFLTKMLQALLVVPGFALVYLIAAPTPLRRRLGHLLASGGAMVVAAGWWVAIVALWPASSRPYIGGSQDNSILNLIFGYNGFGRITGNETGSVIGGRTVGTGGGGGGMWGATGIGRLFGSEMGTQIAWLLPAALLTLVALLVAGRRASRLDGRRAALILWGTWLLVTGLVFSYMRGIVHPYYNVALAPPIAALVGIGAATAWRHRDSLAARLCFAAAVGGTTVWAFVLLDRTPAWLPWLRYAVVAAGLAVTIALAAGSALSRHTTPALRTLFALGVLAALAAPAAYAVQTSSTAHTGSLPSAGPSGAAGLGGPGGARPGSSNGTAPGGRPGAGFAGAPPTGAPGGAGPGANDSGRPGIGRGTGTFGPGTGSPGGGFGGLLDSGTPSSALVSKLKQDASSYRWVAAIVGANSAAGVQLAVDEPVMAIGGFNGTDPAPSLAQFKADVRAGEIHYFVGGTGGGGGGVGSSSSSNAIATWVAQTFTAKTIGGVTVYDLTAAR